ncbi:MAG: hypothetical protein U5L45_09325 [Saprospiraceae bacterium]|nr:hypothetical protein [Saprospiraceae bacterium]
MKKITLAPLSIIVFLAFFLLFSACKLSFLPYNTSIAIQAKRLSPVALTGKRVLIVSYDTDLTREFIISLKNYTHEEFAAHNITTERINIRKNAFTEDIADFDKLKTAFKPDYLLTIKLRDEGFRNFYVVGSSVKTLRGMTIDTDLFPVASEKESAILWTGMTTIKHFYNSEGVATAKKMAKILGITLQKDGLVQ